MDDYTVLTRDEIEAMGRAEVEGLLDFMDVNGKRPHVAKRDRGHYYRNYVKVQGPAAFYTDEELKLLLRLTQWINGKRAPMFMHQLAAFTDKGGYTSVGGFDAGCNFIEFCKGVDAPDTVPWNWRCTRASWSEDSTKPTLAEGLSRFYMGDLSDGMWVAGADMVPHEVVKGTGHGEAIVLAGVEGTFHWETLPLAAPTKAELEELADLYVRECALQKKPHFPLLLKQAG